MDYKKTFSFIYSIIIFALCLWLLLRLSFYNNNGVKAYELFIQPTSSNVLRFEVLRTPIQLLIVCITSIYTAIALVKQKYIKTAKLLNYLILFLLLCLLIYSNTEPKSMFKKMMHPELLFSFVVFAIPCLINIKTLRKLSTLQ